MATTIDFGFQLVDLADAAQALGLSDSTARRMLADGRFPGAVKVSGTWRINLPVLREAVLAGQVG